MGIESQWKDNNTNSWLPRTKDDSGIEKRIKSLYWIKGNKNRLLIMNINVPLVKKNVDLSILGGTIEDLKTGKESIINNPEKYIALGELKGGIDPAGADEHWKTANSALNRIRTSFEKKKLNPNTFFIGAAIENSMANEIFKHLKSATINNAANLTNDKQLTSICEWIVNL
jgi:Restriction endonuclease BsobI